MRAPILYNSPYPAQGSQPSLLILISLLLFFLTLGGCSQISSTYSLKDAQQSFSTAANLENQQKLAPQTRSRLASGVPAVENTAISAAYAATIDILGKIDTKALEKAGLLGNAYALKAISYWRIQQYPLALDYRNRALQLHQQKKNTLGDRDYIMMQILPYLINNDKARKDIIAIRMHKPASQNQEQVLKTLVQSMQALEQVAEEVPADSPLYTYLNVSRVGAFSNYKDTCDLLKSDKDKVACQDKQVICKAKTSYDKLPGTLQGAFSQLFLGYLGNQCSNK